MPRLLMLLLLLAPPAMADVVLCTGMSNASDVCDHWIENNATEHHIINGAKYGFDIVKTYNRPEEFWDHVRKEIAAQGLSPADIDIIWNKNATRGKSGDLIIERQILHDYLIWFQTQAETIFPNLKAGYHSPRSSGEFCSLNPEPYASDTPNAIRGSGEASGAITHFPKWHFGPDLSAATYIEADFRDGCHPSRSGLEKTTPVMNAFFSAPPEPPVPAHDPIVVHVRDGIFEVTWEGDGSKAFCGDQEFDLSANSLRLKIPVDLPAAIRHRCTIDDSQVSNRFGCKSLSECRVW